MRWPYFGVGSLLLTLGLGTGCDSDARPDRSPDAGDSGLDAGGEGTLDPTGGLELVVEPGAAGSPATITVRAVEPIEGVFGVAFRIVYQPTDVAPSSANLERTRQVLSHALRVESETAVLARLLAPGTLALGATFRSPTQGETTLDGTLASVELVGAETTELRAHLERVSIRGADGRLIFPESAP